MRGKSDKKKSLVPRLRFPEFREAGAWEEKKIEDYFSVRSSKRVLQKDWKTHGVPFYRTRELVSLYNNEPFSSEIFISEELFSEIAKKYGFPSEGDFLVSGVGTLGICYQVKAKDKFYFKDGNVLWYKQNGGIVSSFFYYCFHSDQIQNQILGQASISTVGTYTIQNAKVTKFLCPTVEKEQQKIAHCLSSLDEVMGLQAKKVQALKQHKKGLMQQLFPAEGETTPRLRFPDFREAGAWEVRRLGEIGKISKGKGISKSDIKPNGALPCIRYGELYTHYGEVIRDVVSFTDANPGNLVLSEENDVIIPASGETKEDIATASCVSVKGVALGGDLNIFYSPMNGMFLAYYIRGNLKFEISKVAQGNSVVHLYTTQLEKLKLAVPPYPKEQQKIAHCLSSLDEVIGLESHKLDALKNLKKGLMQQLFPQEVA
ncbi:restriction endonuclease subunit S [Thiolapillus sp.]|uniref:restriction endonuclease subunit S n=4 Tax=Thiolapillus sp. TaxID=2017437 RepID=UPI003AF5F80B